MENKSELNSKLENLKEEPKICNEFFENSMLFYINPSLSDKSDNIKKDPPSKTESPLLINNYIEKCYIKDEYNIYEKSFEYKAIGLGKRGKYPISEIPLIQNRIIEIKEFKIDEKNIEYNFNKENSNLAFDTINFKNEQTIKIYLKYQESKKLTEEQKKQRKVYIEDTYGLSPNLEGLEGSNAIFYLIIENDMEIISLDEIIFIKEKENVYKFEGLVPKGGKRTRVILSKKKAKYKVCYTKNIKTKNKENIKDTKIALHYYFEGGGNKKNEIKINPTTNPPNKIIKNEKEKLYDIKFKNINQNKAEIKIEGEIINNCSGEWLCDLTDEQIEKEIPQDYKTDCEKLKEIAENIIKEYDEKNKNNKVAITDIAKIGKWVKENVKYDENYEKENITALEFCNKKEKKGVCEQFTFLFNALLYSLGYKCICVSGFVLKDKDSFDSDDAHAWSLVRVNGKWLPFDATWGIFSGKLSVGHIFGNYFLKTNTCKTQDDLDKQADKVSGNFIE